MMDVNKLQISSTTSTAAREVTPYWREKYEKDARKYWDKFYKRHQGKFFKDRHYLKKEWGCHFDTEDGRKAVVLEVGCGAGNTVFPLISKYPRMFMHACDFSSRAIELVKGHKDFSEDRINAFVCDLLVDDLSEKVLPSSVDVVTMIFMLSAVAPEKMDLVLKNIRKVMKPNGHLLLRDYAVGDLAQERFTSKEQMISENFYVRGDGTRAFYFSNEFLSTLFANNGFYSEQIHIFSREVENRSRELLMNRRWIQAAFTLYPTSAMPVNKQDTCGEGSYSEEMGNGKLVGPLVQDSQIAISETESVGDLFDNGMPPADEIVDIKLKSCSFKIKVVGKENQHTCKLTGLMLWESARFMSMLLDENPSIVTGKVVLELGCGSAGICSMVAAKSAELVVSTDGDLESLDLLCKNISSNMGPALVAKPVIKRLSWGNQMDIDSIKGLLEPKKGFDVIVGTDVTYNPDAIQPLFETARKLIVDQEIDENERASLILCHMQRRVDEESIIAAASKFDFGLVDKLVHGECVQRGIISSWFSDSLKKQYYHEKVPLNIMLFQI